jgi:hypothetical protein
VVLSVFVFCFPGTSFGNIPRAIMVLSGTGSLEGRDGNPISCFDSL